AGPAAELVVDPAAVVPLRADDVQPAHRGDLAARRPRLLLGLDRLDRGLPDVVRDVEAAGVLVLELGPGHGLRVAAENDVRAATGHVGGDRHRALAAGLGDDVGLAGDVLRLCVQ